MQTEPEQLHISVARGTLEQGMALCAYTVPVAPGDRLSVLDALYYIAENVDPTLAFYGHADCKQGACGRCAVKVNGTTRLACMEPVADGMVVEPCRPGKVVRDLVCR